MFARIATVQTLERQHAVRAQVRQPFPKVQEPERRDAPLRPRRPVLTRRWELDPASGKPVCTWQVEGPDLPPDLTIDPTKPAQKPQLLWIAVWPRLAAAGGRPSR
jgi:hypothetical protein